jgi:O-antigen/teichoic acid export membrane protein
MSELAIPVGARPAVPVSFPQTGAATAAKAVSLRRNVAWTLVGNVAYSGCQWLMLVMLTKMTNASMVGQFGLGLAVTAPVFQFSNLQLRAVQATDARHEYRFDQYLGVRLIFTVLGFLVVAALASVGGHSLRASLVVLLVGAAKSVECVSDIFQGLFQRQEQMDRVAKSLMYKALASVVAVGAILAVFHDVLIACAALAAAWLCVFLAYDVTRGRRVLAQWAGRLRPSFSMQVFKRLFLLALPLGFVMMLLSLNANLPRYFLDLRWGDRELGIFSALIYCMVAGNTVVNAVGQSASPRLANYYAAGQMRGFRRLLLRLLLLGGGLGAAGVIVAVFAGRPLLVFLYRPEYAAHTDTFIALMVAGAIGYISGFLGVAMTAMRGFKPQAWIHAGCTLLGLVACSVLVPRMGILGAAFAVILLSAAALIGFTWCVFSMLRAADRTWDRTGVRQAMADA